MFSLFYFLNSYLICSLSTSWTNFNPFSIPKCHIELNIIVSEWNEAEPGDAARGVNQRVRIAFVFTVNGRAVRQIKRLLKNLYSSKHFYYFHVDEVS